MRHKKDHNALAAIALFLLLTSCGPSPQTGGGIGGTGITASIASGQITDTSPNNVSISGYNYITDSTSMTVDGKSGSQRDLKKGMVVLINATLSHNYGTNDPPQRTADTLMYEDTVEGVVQSVAKDGSSLVVLGQTVTISTTTVVDPSIPGQSVLNLVPGRDLLEISGFVTGDGTIVGTLIDLKTVDPKTGLPDYEVKGLIKNHDAAQKTFEIGSLTIDYHDAKLNDMPGQSNGVWNALLVDVRGIQVSSGSVGVHSVRMTATLVWPEGLGIKDNADAKIEGFVTQVLSPGDFSIGNVHALTNADTTFEGGTTSDIQVGAHLEVHGPLVGGIVNTTKVEFEDTKIERFVTQVFGPGDFSIGNVHVLTNADTAFVSGTMSDIQAGTHLEVYGPLVDGIVNATKVEFE
jgi:Domain of unknown function (DUF5666)